MYFHTGGRINTDRLNIDMFCRTFPISHFILLRPGFDLSRLVDPAVVLVTGDLTDAKSRDCSGSEQTKRSGRLTTTLSQPSPTSQLLSGLISGAIMIPLMCHTQPIGRLDIDIYLKYPLHEIIQISQDIFS